MKSSSLLPLLLGLVVGAGISYLGVAVWRGSSTAAGVKQPAARAGSASGAAGGDVTSGNATNTETAGKPLAEGESILSVLRAAAAKMTPEQRMAEIEGMLKSDSTFDMQNYMNSWAEFHTSFMALMAPEDLERLKAMALSQPPGTTGTTGMPQMSRWAFQTAFIMSWADWNEPQVEAWLPTYKETEGGFMVPISLYALGSKWAKDDPFAGIDHMQRLMKTIPASPMNSGSFQVLIAAAAKKNPQLAFQKGMSLENNEQRQGAVAAALGEMAKTDFKAALKLAGDGMEPGLAKTLKDRVLSSYLYGSSDKDRFINTAEYVLSDEGEGTRDSTLYSLMYQWNAKDSDAAMAWAAANKDILEPYNIMDNLERKADKRKTTDELLAEAESMPEGKDREKTLSTAYGKLITRDPEAALEKLTQLDEETAAKVLPNLLYNYTQNDPAFLAKNFSKLPGKDVQKNTVGQLMDSWMGVNPTAATAWLDTQPVGEIKDQGISKVVNSTVGKDPEAAGAWALQASTEKGQIAQLKNVAGKWKATDAEAARRWIWQQPAVSVKVRDEFLSALDKK